MKEACYGTVNGEPVFTHNEFIYKSRGFGAITSDKDLVAFSKKVTHGWMQAGWERSFRTYFLSNYSLAEPCRSLTTEEFSRLKVLQKQVREEYKKTEAARNWQYIKTVAYADNSVEELWRDKNGIEKTVMVKAPGGDACY